ncbi:hypothetical protein CEXT_34841 [Caerostris extrusa]|uniref:Secreted protein n=1 Tax=Caerostris extrusa TaxID=172846 RepID=A0AAV4Y782_CAEEX|nr:hypothetical protein CEXT_34841 [Caerostris extrusa]
MSGFCVLKIYRERNKNRTLITDSGHGVGCLSLLFVLPNLLQAWCPTSNYRILPPIWASVNTAIDYCGAPKCFSFAVWAPDCWGSHGHPRISARTSVKRIHSRMHSFLTIGRLTAKG